MESIQPLLTAQYVSKASDDVQDFGQEKKSLNDEPFLMSPNNVEPEAEATLLDATTLTFNLIHKALNLHLSENVFTADVLNKQSESNASSKAFIQPLFDTIDSRVSSAQVRGASSGEIKSVLDSMLEKIHTGLFSAKNEAQALGILDPETADMINSSEQLVAAHVDKLNQNGINNKTPLTTQNNIEGSASSSNATKSSFMDLITDGVKALNVTNQQYSSQSKTSDLTIKTADGDLVTIKFSAQQSSSQSQAFQYNNNNQTQHYQYQQSASSNESRFFSFSIEGDIDEEEYAAISSLVSDIQSLQNEFFHGDIMKAYEQALSIGFDDQELAGFSLDLTKSTQHVASETYQAVAKFDQPKEYNALDSHGPKNEFVKVLGFIDQLKQLQENAQKVLVESSTQVSSIISHSVNTANQQNTVVLKQFEHFYQKFSA